MKRYEFKITGLDCANCANKLETILSQNENLENVSLSYAKEKLVYETDSMTKEEVEKIIKKHEPEVELVDLKDNLNNQDTSKTLLQVLRLAIGLAIALIGLFVNMPKIMSVGFIVVGYFILLYRTIKNAIRIFISSRTINENLLITISCIGAYLVGKHMEGLMVITLYEIGKILEDKAVNKTRKSISDLMDIRPEYANLKKGEEIKRVSPEEVNIGDILIIKNGEKIPLDGIVIKGNASLNTASLTGESKPQEVKEQDNVLSGSLLIDGLLEIRVTEKYENSTVNRILELVENATDKKAKTETFVNKAAKIYTPIVLFIAVLVASLLPLISNVPYTTENGSIYRALIFLVISCPCAIAISVPLCYFSGIGKSSKEGILIKGSDYLDGLKNLKEIVFDKTGTLTSGKFSIDRIEVLDGNYKEDEVLRFAVIGESYSNHPIAKSLVKASGLDIDNSKIKDYSEISGKGISYSLDGKKVLVGSSNLMDIKNEKSDSTKIYVKVDENIIGAIYLKDTVKHGTKEALEKLNKKDIITKMLTGDNKNIADEIAKEIGIEEVKAQMLPEDKYNELQKDILKYREKDKDLKTRVAFVGDGINDSPVLALADIGISMGGIGSGSAIEASDVVIMTDSIDKINDAIDISKKTSKIIKQNLIFAIGVKVLVLLLSTLGLADMWQAVFADVGVTLITILNSIRILK